MDNDNSIGSIIDVREGSDKERTDRFLSSHFPLRILVNNIDLSDNITKVCPSTGCVYVYVRDTDGAPILPGTGTNWEPLTAIMAAYHCVVINKDGLVLLSW